MKVLEEPGNFYTRILRSSKVSRERIISIFPQKITRKSSKNWFNNKEQHSENNITSLNPRMLFISLQEILRRRLNSLSQISRRGSRNSWDTIKLKLSEPTTILWLFQSQNIIVLWWKNMLTLLILDVKLLLSEIVLELWVLLMLHFVIMVRLFLNVLPCNFPLSLLIPYPSPRLTLLNSTTNLIMISM